MSEERKAVLIPIGVVIVLLLIVGVGIGYYKPSYCNTAIGFITCWRNKQNQSAYDYDEEFLQNDLPNFVDKIIIHCRGSLFISGWCCSFRCSAHSRSIH